MAFTFPAMVAWDPNGKLAVKNVSFQVYATTDTAFTTPLPITDPFGNPLTGNILNSGTQGVFPQFQQATNSTVVIADATKTYAWTVVSASNDATTASFINTTGSASALAVKSEVTTGATSTALNATYVGKGSAYIDVKDAAYGAKGDGVTNDTAAIQAAVNAAIAPGGPGVVRAVGNFYVPGTVNITGGSNKACIIMGGGAGDHAGYNWHTRFFTDSPTSLMFNITESGTVFQDVLLENTSSTTPTAGGGIAGTTVGGMRLERCTIKGFYLPLDISQAPEWSMHNCVIYNFVQYGVRIANTLQPDSGDQTISDTWFSSFDSTRSPGPAIRWESGGGLKLANVKINGSTKCSKGLELSLTSTTTDLFVSNCSFENITGHGIHLHQNGAATATFKNITIVGGNFARYSTDTTSNDIRIDPANGTTPFADVAIAGVSFLATTAGQTSVYMSNMKNLSIDGVWDGYTRALQSDSLCVNVPVEPKERSWWIPASNFKLAFGSPTESNIQRTPVWILPKSTESHVGAMPPVLPWGTCGADLYWANNSAAAGNIRAQLTIDGKAFGSALAAAGTSAGPATTATAGAQNVPVKTALAGPDSAYSVAVPNGGLMRVSVARLSADAADTLAGDIGLIGVLLRRTD